MLTYPPAGPDVDTVYDARRRLRNGLECRVPLGLGLVLLGSMAHAVWNLLIKRSGVAGTAFVWLYSALATPVLLGLLLIRASAGAGLATSYWWAAIISAALHTAYALVLQGSYARAELGVVYPVARAGAPVLVALASITLLHQSTAPTLWLGIALIGIGVPLLVGTSAGSASDRLTGVLAGSATATAIAAYTLWDGYAVTRLHVDVLSYLTIGSLTQFAVLTLAVIPARSRVAAVARTSWRLAFPIALLVPLSYGLVLAALHHVDVPVAAAARSSSILASSILGWCFLGESRSPRRVAGAAILTLGVTAVAL